MVGSRDGSGGKTLATQVWGLEFASRQAWQLFVTLAATQEAETGEPQGNASTSWNPQAQSSVRNSLSINKVESDWGRSPVSTLDLYMHVHTQLHAHTCKDVYMYTHTHHIIQIWTYTYLWICIYVCIYKYIWMVIKNFLFNKCFNWVKNLKGRKWISVVHIHGSVLRWSIIPVGGWGG